MSALDELPEVLEKATKELAELKGEVIYRRREWVKATETIAQLRAELDDAKRLLENYAITSEYGDLSQAWEEERVAWLSKHKV